MFGTSKRLLSVSSRSFSRNTPQNITPSFRSNERLQVRYTSQTAQLRRQQIRELTRPKVDFDSLQDEDSFIFEFPSKVIGDNSSVNWQLNAHDITPSQQVYHNLHLRRLIQESTGKLDANKALHVTNTTAANKVTYTAEADQKKFKELKRYLEKRDLFVHDAAVGSHRSAETKVRVITDNPHFALYLRHTLPAVPLGEVEAFNPAYVVYVASGYSQDAPFSFVDSANKVVALAGTDSTSDLRNALYRAALTNVGSSNALPLPGDLLTFGKNSVLVVNTDGLLLKQKWKDVNVNGAHNVFWSPLGVVRAWNGLSHSNKDTLSRGDLVESLTDKTVQVTTPLQAQPNVSAHPSSVVFLVSDSQGFLPTVSKLNPSQASQFFASGYDGKTFTPFFDKALSSSNVSTLLSTFTSLVAQSKAGVYIVNATPKGKALDSNDLKQILNATADGSASSAKTGSGFASLTPITALSGVKNLDSGDAKGEQKLVSFVKATFPDVTF